LPHHALSDRYDVRTAPLQKQFAPVSPDIVWDGKQPVMFFAKALDLDFRQQIAMGLNAYGTPVFVGYAFRPPETTKE
jgi:hypothetical protein